MTMKNPSAVSHSDNQIGNRQTVRSGRIWLRWVMLAALPLLAAALLAAAAPRDYNGDGKSDLLIREDNGAVSAALVTGTSAVAPVGIIPANSGWTVTHVADFTGDGKADLLMQNTDGRIALLVMNGTAVSSYVEVLAAGTGWRVTNVGDFNADQKPDLLMLNTDGRIAVLLMNGTSNGAFNVLTTPGSLYRASDVGDLNGDGAADILLTHPDGSLTALLMSGGLGSSAAPILNAGSPWRMTHLADLSGDGKADIVLKHNDGSAAILLMNGTAVASAAYLLTAGSPWAVMGVGNFNGDGKADLLIKHSDGSVVTLIMNGTAVVSATTLLTPGSTYVVGEIGDYNGDGKSDILLRGFDGTSLVAFMNGGLVQSVATINGPGGYQVAPTPETGRAPIPIGAIQNPILFVTQVPTLSDFASRASTFGNHRAALDSVVRGGDLMIRYPDGSLRNLTKEAGYGMDGMQGDNAIAVREPAVHWSGKKAVFSMVRGSATAQYQVRNYYWQLYEVSGLGKGETVSMTKVANQPANYNNISPIYASDDRILFTTDRPRTGEAHLYPQLDEYESTATVTGIWSLNPSTGELKILNHTPSGAFSPTIDSYGRVVFTRWDHLQRDQQADAGTYGAFNYSDESVTAAKLNSQAEMFPEPRDTSSSVFGPVAGYTNNRFTPWQMNQDGMDEETLNHVGQQEMGFGYIPKSFTNDPALSDLTDDTLHANKKTLRSDGGIYHVKEDPVRPGIYYSIYAREFGSLTSNQIVRFNGGVGTNPERMVFTDFTLADNSDGRYRNPLPLSDGKFVATHTPTTVADPNLLLDFRLKQLTPNAAGRYVPGPALTGGISKSVSWWDPDNKRTFNGLLWEFEAVEVVARPRPAASTLALEAPESAVFAEEAVDEAALRGWLQANDLAMIVTRNQTTRDRADFAQPFNLQVPGGVKTVSPKGGKVYDISHFQIVQADQIRGYSNFSAGRRSIPQPLHDPKAKNPANPGGPAGSVKIAADGSTAALVPARRALAWQSTDAAGNPVVRERVWVTFQPGEVRVCASCHGVNEKDQSGAPPPVNKPEALRDLLRFWKALPK
jgi:Hydrazine synthase alpha subunit middle domain/FG-GAP-like repeat